MHSAIDNLLKGAGQAIHMNISSVLKTVSQNRFLAIKLKSIAFWTNKSKNVKNDKICQKIYNLKN